MRILTPLVPVPSLAAVAVAAAAVLAVSGAAPHSAAAQLPSTAASPSDLRTPAEASGFQRHTSHDEMMAYLGELRTLAADMELGSLGTTLEGRELPRALFSRPRVTSPAEAHASGKPVVVLAANIHGFNHVVREALLILMRELGTPGTDMNRLLDEVIVLVVPSKNPDGLEAGIRFNARGADMNRDYMVLEEPATAAYVGRLLTPWAPHLVVDGHDGGDVQYGGAAPYHLLYQGPGLAGADPALTSWVDDRVIPHLNRALGAEGFRGFYWSRGSTEGWIAGGSAPRMGRNYGGLANRVTILFELTAWPGLGASVEVARAALRGILTHARDEGPELVATVQRARETTVTLGSEPQGRIPVRETMEAAPERVRFQVADPEREGAFVWVEDAEILKQPVGTRFRERPWAYVLPPGAESAVALLRRHGIAVDRLTRDTSAPVRSYLAGEVAWIEGASLRARVLHVDVADEVDDTRVLPAGSWVVRTGQPLGRVVAHLLEAETGDGLYHWGYLTPFLPPDPVGEELPIRSLMRPVPLPLAEVDAPGDRPRR